MECLLNSKSPLLWKAKHDKKLLPKADRVFNLKSQLAVAARAALPCLFPSLRKELHLKIQFQRSLRHSTWPISVPDCWEDGDTGISARRWVDTGDTTWSYLLATWRAAGSSELVWRERGQEPMSALRTCLPVTSHWHSTCSLHPDYLQASFQKVTTLGTKKTHPKWRTGRRVTWPPGAGPVALHAASVDGKQYRLMFMPYVLDLFTYQHQNPVSVQSNTTRSYWEEGHSLIRQTAEKTRFTNEDWERLNFTKQALALEGSKYYPAEVLTVSPLSNLSMFGLAAS